MTKITKRIMNRIMLITTKGCEGCTIARNSIKDAISQTKKSISCEEIDVNEVNKKFLKTFDIEDFPAILFFKDKKLKYGAYAERALKAFDECLARFDDENNS